MKKALTYLKGNRLEACLGPLFKLFEAGFELIVPFVIASIVDEGIPACDAGAIIRAGLILVGLALLGLVCSVTAQYFAAKASVSYAGRLRHALFAHIQRLSYADYDRAGAATLITRMTSDINQVQSGMNLGLRLFLRSPFIVFGAMIMAFTIDTRMASIFAIVIPVLSVIVFSIMLVTMPKYKKTQEQLDDVMMHTRENLSGTRVLRAFGREEDEIRGFNKSHERLTRLQTRTARISALMNPLTYVAINIALIILLNTGAIQVNTGRLTAGQVLALVNYLGQILIELIKLANLIITVSKAVACYHRVQSVLAIRPSLVSPAKPIKSTQSEPGRVVFQNVSTRYSKGASEALSNISFTAHRGQFIGIIGGTGSGKTTLVNLIPRFYDVSAGTVLVDGIDVKQFELSQLRSQIAIVPQHAQLFRGTIRENLLWGNPQADDDALMEAIRAAQAEDVLSVKGGLDAMLEQSGRNLSGGQRQRLTIARALVRRPSILILDDSASALDYATDARLRIALRKLPYRPTVFIVSQRTASVRYADRILVLDDGRAVGWGEHDALLTSCPVYREIFDSQFRKEA